MGPCDMTVVVTVYNQPLSDIEKTLASIAVQEDCDYELLIGDDHSKKDVTSEIERLCEKLGIKNYRIIRHECNLKTVGNVLECLKHAEGTYVKLIGSGDTLYSKTTLRDIVAFLEENKVRAGFGDIIIEETGDRFAKPRNITDFELGKCPNRGQLVKHMLFLDDGIPGGAQFFETAYMASLLRKLYDDYGVRYAEDFAQVIALADDMVYHLDLPVLIYDNKGGISTSGAKESRRRMYDDHLHFYQGMKDKHLLGQSYMKEYMLFRLRRFVALTPLHPICKRLLMRSYSKKVSRA